MPITQIPTSHKTFVNRYALVMGLLFFVTLLCYYVLNFDAKDFIVVAPMLSAFSAGTHFYRVELRAPFTLLWNFSTCVSWMIINGMFFYLMYYLYLRDYTGSLMSPVMQQQMFTVIGLALSEVYWRKRCAYEQDQKKQD